MLQRYFIPLAMAGFLAAQGAAQTSTKVDFARDVLPVLRQNCFGCHGPGQQTAGLRLDRRSSALKQRRVVPSSSDNSMVYRRLIGPDFGIQMPPTGPLKPEQINVIKAWIDQGADWPDALANELDLPPLNPKAVAMVEMLRSGDRQGFLKAVAEDPKLLNARGPEGSTPFMYAVLYTDSGTVEKLVKTGANVNARNDAKATALMWAASDFEKTRILVSHGADVNAISDDMRTPLMVAAGHPGGTATVKFLLDHGANPSPVKTPGQASPLTQAAVGQNPEALEMLIARGADLKQAAPVALDVAIQAGCIKCVDILAKQNFPKESFTIALADGAVLADPKIIRVLVEHGADVNVVDPTGRTPLMYAAISDVMPLETVKLLIEHGADVNARSGHEKSGDTGLSVLDIARQNGETPVVDLLVKAGAKSAVAMPQPATPVAESRQPADLRSAVQRAIPLLQRTDEGFSAKAGCISCHNNSLGAMTIGLARKNGFRVDEEIAARQVKVNVSYLEHQRDMLHQGAFAGGGPFGDTFGESVLGYILVGLAAENHRADLNTDAVAMYLKARQMPDGQWAYPAADTRPPICLDYVGQTALSMRALQLYAPKADKPEYDRAIRMAATWIAEVEPKTNEDRFWKLMGLAWAGQSQAAMQKVLKDVLSRQRADGGWSDLPTMQSTAYATGRALVAIQTAGVPVTDAAYQRGVQYLMNTQMADGSWHVRTRALGFQPYFDSGYPHGYDQAISAAGSGWATMALTLAAGSPASKSTTAGGEER